MSESEILPPEALLDEVATRRGFDRYAHQYGRLAQLQAAVRGNLLERLELLRLSPRWVLDLGSGSVPPSRQLLARYRKAVLVAVDLSHAMLREIPRQGWLSGRRFTRVCARADRLPFAADSIDLVFSSLMLQWSNAPCEVFRELCRVLRPGGALLFSTMGPDTLRELRESWWQVDAYPHVHRFPDMQLLGQWLGESGLRDVVLDRELRVQHFADCHALMHSLRGIGAGNRQRGRRLSGKGRLQQMIAAYERLRGDAGLPASFEIIYGLTWKLPPASRPGPTEYAVPVHSIRRR